MMQHPQRQRTHACHLLDRHDIFMTASLDSAERKCIRSERHVTSCRGGQVELVVWLAQMVPAMPRHGPAARGCRSCHRCAGRGIRQGAPGCRCGGGAGAARTPKRRSAPATARVGRRCDERDTLPKQGRFRELSCLRTPAADVVAGLLGFRGIDAQQAHA